MPEPLTDVDLAVIRERCDAATPGKWRRQAVNVVAPSGDDVCWLPRYPTFPAEREVQARADAAFIAHARTDVPRLLAEVERLQEEVTRWRGLLREAADEIDRQREILDRFRQVGAALRTATEEEGPESRGSHGLQRVMDGMEQAVSILLNRRNP